MRDILKPGLILLIITAVAGACLGAVYEITKEPIRISKEKARTEALAILIPAAEEFKEEIQIPEGAMVDSVDTAYSGGNVVGYVVGVSPKGYSGTLNILVGLNTDGVIEGIRIVGQSETPGLGANCTKPAFYEQYTGKSEKLTVTKSGSPGANEIDAITSSTITSTAVTDGVNNALEFIQNELR